jgi:hypothetical protein
MDFNSKCQFSSLKNVEIHVIIIITTNTTTAAAFPCNLDHYI